MFWILFSVWRAVRASFTAGSPKGDFTCVACDDILVTADPRGAGWRFETCHDGVARWRCPTCQGE